MAGRRRSLSSHVSEEVGGGTEGYTSAYVQNPFTHLMTKSMSLLAMVTTTSGTLYGVLRWLSMVALKAPDTKAEMHAGRFVSDTCVCVSVCV